eukprot:gene20016-21977_t
MSKGRPELVADIICEFLEVAFNVILFKRGVYPDGIFRQRQKYKIAVAMSCHPELNKYIMDILTGLKTMLLSGKVDSVSLQIITNDEQPIERFTFELLLFENDDMDLSKSQQIEDYLRDILLKINTCDSELDPIPKDCSFLISVQTRGNVANEIVDSDTFQTFPWIKNDNLNKLIENNTIIPLKSCITNLFNIQCFVETERGAK